MRAKYHYWRMIRAGKIVKVVDHKACRDPKFLHDLFPIGFVTRIGRDSVADIFGYPLINIPDWCVFMDATDREKFLYEMYGPGIYGEINEF